mgnify:CR=1 FL=1
MKKLSILFFATFTVLLSMNGFSQEEKPEASEKLEVAAKEEIKSKRIKIDLERLPNSILVSLRDSYAKYFVTQAYKSNKKGDVYFIELRRGRTLFTVAVDAKGRVLKEIRDGLITDKNAVANKN